MTANINIQNKPIASEQTRPGLKIAAHPSSETNTETKQTTIHSIASTDTEQKIELSNVNKTEENADEKESSKQVLDQAVKKMNSYVQSINRSLEFKVDNDSGQTVVKVIDMETDELIRQIPNKEALHIAKQLEMGLSEGDKDPGLLLIKAQA